MLKRIFVTLIVGLLLAVSAMMVLAQTETQISSACQNVDATDSVVRIGVPEGAVGSGIVACRVIHDGSRFNITPAAIGNLGVLQRGVRAAIDVYASVGGGSVVNFGQEVQVCLKGTGSFIFLNANQTPRIPSEMPAFTRDLEGGTYTCTYISSAGVAVLVNGPTASPATDSDLVVPTADDALASDEAETAGEDAAPVSVAPVVTADGSVSLSGCRVTTTAMVRLRTEPTTSSEVITRLPFRYSLQATSRTTDSTWYQVIFEDGQGWLSGRYITESAGCSD